MSMEQTTITVETEPYTLYKYSTIALSTANHGSPLKVFRPFEASVQRCLMRAWFLEPHIVNTHMRTLMSLEEQAGGFLEELQTVIEEDGDEQAVEPFLSTVQPYLQEILDAEVEVSPGRRHNLGKQTNHQLITSLQRRASELLCFHPHSLWLLGHGLVQFFATANEESRRFILLEACEAMPYMFQLALAAPARAVTLSTIAESDDALAHAVLVLMSFNDADEAFKVTQLRVAKVGHMLDQAANILYHDGQTFRRAQCYRQAHLAMQNAIDLYEECGQPQKVREAMRQKAMVFHDEKLDKECLEGFKVLLAHERYKAPQPPNDRLAQTFVDVGNLSVRVYEIDQALEHYQEAAVLRKNASPSARASIALCIGLSYQLKRDYQNARGHYEEALSLHRNVFRGDSQELAETIRNNAVICYRLGELPKALQLADEALEIYRRGIARGVLDLSSDFVFALSTCGWNLLRSGQIQQAKLRLQESYETEEKVRSRRGGQEKLMVTSDFAFACEVCQEYQRASQLFGDAMNALRVGLYERRLFLSSAKEVELAARADAVKIPLQSDSSTDIKLDELFETSRLDPRKEDEAKKIWLSAVTCSGFELVANSAALELIVRCVRSIPGVTMREMMQWAITGTIRCYVRARAGVFEDNSDPTESIAALNSLNTLSPETIIELEEARDLATGKARANLPSYKLEVTRFVYDAVKKGIDDCPTDFERQWIQLTLDVMKVIDQ